MAMESAGYGRREIYLQPQLRQRLPFLSADSQEPARRTQLGPDGVSHDAPRRLPAHQPRGSTRQSGAGGNDRQMAGESSLARHGAWAAAGLSATARRRDASRGDRIRAAARAPLGA